MAQSLPEGARSRAAESAARSMQLLAAACLIAAPIVYFVLPVVGSVYFMAFPNSRLRFFFGSAFTPATAAGFLLGLAAGDLVCAIFVRLKHYWAALLGIVLASIQMLCVLPWVALAFYVVFLSPGPDSPSAYIGLIVTILMAAAVMQLMWHLLVALKSVRDLTRAGFEPVMGRAVLLDQPPDADSANGRQFPPNRPPA